ncbi:unknow (plasmid) [Vibrio campbellii]|nr:unknow [Vibrio campbellii]
MATGNAEMKYRDTDKEIVEYSIFAVCLLILMLFIALTLVNDNWFGA